MRILNRRNGIVLMGLIYFGSMMAIFLSNPVAQSSDYHVFSDTVTLFSIPNALNVISNIPFIYVGIAGLLALKKNSKKSFSFIHSNKISYLTLFFGTILMGFGSGYYHLWPSNEALLWDRIPMTIAFMGLYSVTISEFISEKIGRYVLVPLVMLGLGSVFYWWYTESLGAGDLRYYALVQFLPILTIPVMLLFFKSKFSTVSGYWLLLTMYSVAKVLEIFDVQVHGALLIVSGHSIKHVFAAMGLYLLLRSYLTRESVIR